VKEQNKVRKKWKVAPPGKKQVPHVEEEKRAPVCTGGAVEKQKNKMRGKKAGDVLCQARGG